MRPTCAVAWVLLRSKWMPRQMAPVSARWRTTVAARLPSLRWPERLLRIVAVDAHSGEPVVFDRQSGVDLVDAVAASCANGFGVPPHGIGDSRFIDGGYRRSSENADLAAGYGRVLVLSPLGGRTRTPLDWGMNLATQVDELRALGSRVETILPDNASRNAFGGNLMDLSTRLPAAQAGYDQGVALSERLIEILALTPSVARSPEMTGIRTCPLRGRPQRWRRAQRRVHGPRPLLPRRPSSARGRDAIAVRWRSSRRC